MYDSYFVDVSDLINYLDALVYVSSAVRSFEGVHTYGKPPAMERGAAQSVFPLSPR